MSDAWEAQNPRSFHVLGGASLCMGGNDDLVDSTKASGKVMAGSARKLSRRGGEKKRTMHACSICSKAKVSEVGGEGEARRDDYKSGGKSWGEQK